jgi:hypothetical protein
VLGIILVFNASPSVSENISVSAQYRAINRLVL